MIEARLLIKTLNMAMINNGFRNGSEHPEKLYLQLLDLEKEYRLLMDTSKRDAASLTPQLSVLASSSVKQRGKVVDQFCVIAKLDAEYCLEKSLESFIWKQIYYSEISETRKICAKSESNKVFTVFRKFLREAFTSFKHVISELCSHYGLRQLRALSCSLLDISKRPPGRRATEASRAAANRLAHQLLIYTGDVARYWQQLPLRYRQKAPLPEPFYKAASRLFPDVGLAYNQLAVVKSQFDALEGLEYYIRAICCAQPFVVAHRNISALFRQFLSGKDSVNISYRRDEARIGLLKFFATLFKADCELDFCLLAEETAKRLNPQNARMCWSSLVAAIGMAHLQLFPLGESTLAKQSVVTAAVVFVLSSVFYWTEKNQLYVQKDSACDSSLSCVRLVLLWLIQASRSEALMRVICQDVPLTHLRTALKCVLQSLICRRKANLKPLLLLVSPNPPVSTVTSRDLVGFLPVWPELNVAKSPQSRVFEELQNMVCELRDACGAFKGVFDDELDLLVKDFTCLFFNAQISQASSEKTLAQSVEPLETKFGPMSGESDESDDEQIIFAGTHAFNASLESSAPPNDVELLPLQPSIDSIKQHLPTSLVRSLFDSSDSCDLSPISMVENLATPKGEVRQSNPVFQAPSIWMDSSGVLPPLNFCEGRLSSVERLVDGGAKPKLKNQLTVESIWSA